jgi:hypothetical protein
VLQRGFKPALVVADDYSLVYVNSVLPKDVPLTTFGVATTSLSGLFADYLKGAARIGELEHSNRILIIHSSTTGADHCDREKDQCLISAIKAYTKKELFFDELRGTESIARPLTSYALVIYCASYKSFSKHAEHRLQPFIDKGIPVTDAALACAFLSGLLDRVVELFG